MVKRNRTVRRQKRMQAEPDRIKDAELERHRRAFLGEPGSKKWKEYHQGLLTTKQRLFGSKRPQGKYSRSRTYGGVKGEGEDEEQKDGEDEERKYYEDDEYLSEEEDNEPNPAATQKANSLLRKKIPEIKTENGKPIPKEASKIQKLNTLCSAIAKGSSGEKLAQKLIDLREEGIDDLVKEYNANPEQDILEDLDKLLEEYEKILIEINRGNVIYKSNNAAAQDRISKTYGVHWLADIVEEPDMKLLMEFAKQINSGSPIKVPDAWSLNDEKKPFDFGYETLKAQINAFPPTAEEVKIEYVPFFLQVYLKLIGALNERKEMASTDMNYRMKKSDDEDITSLRTIRRLILFSIRILRDMNMYVNPLFFDDLYYYYYFLQLDRFLPSLDSIFRGVFPSKEENPGEKGAQVTMRVTEQAASDSNPEKVKYGVDFRERFFNYDPTRDFDMWLNMIRVRPNFDSVPVAKEIAQNFKMTQKPDARTGDKSAFTTEVSEQKMENYNYDGPHHTGNYEKHDSTSENNQKQKTDIDEEREEGMGEEDGNGDEYDDEGQEYGEEDDGGEVDGEQGKQEGGGESNSGIPGTIEKGDRVGNYHFLEDNPLARRFEDLSEELNPSYKVHLCVYSLDRSCKTPADEEIPFLKYLTQKSEEQWAFPSFQYDLAENGAESNDNDFQCETFTRLLESLGISLCGSSEQSVVEGTSGGATDPIPASQETSTENLSQDNPESAPVEEQSTDNLPQDNPEYAAPLQSEEGSESGSKCASMESAIESIYQGMLLKKMEDGPHIFVFFNYDILMSMTNQDMTGGEPNQGAEQPPSEQQPNPEAEASEQPPLEEQPNPDASEQQPPLEEQPNQGAEQPPSEQQPNPEASEQPPLEEQSNPEAEASEQPPLEEQPNPEVEQTPSEPAKIFCSSRPKIVDEQESELRWATVDELVFEKKMFGQSVDPIIPTVFREKEMLWNITDANTGEYIDFPFVVYGLKEMPDGTLGTITVEDGKNAGEESILSVNQIGKYGKPELADQYGMRYCFTIQPFELPENQIAKRFALFALNVEYLVDDAELDSLPAPQSGGGEPMTDKNQPQTENPEINSATPNEEPQTQSDNPENNSATPNEEPQSENPENPENNSAESAPPNEEEQQQPQPENPENPENPETNSAESAPLNEEQQTQPENPEINSAESAPPNEEQQTQSENPEINSAEQPDEYGNETLGDPNQEMDESLTDAAQTPTIYCVTNNSSTNNSAYVTWAVFKQSQFCGL